MAVSKMQRCTILVEKSHQMTLLESIQELQAFEPITLSTTNDIDDKINDIQVLDESIQNVILVQHILKRVQIKAEPFKRRYLSFTELEHFKESIEQENIVKYILSLDEQQKQLQDKYNKLLEKEALLQKWQQLPFLQHHIKQMLYVYTFIGTLPQLTHDDNFTQLKRRDDLFVDTLFQDSLERGIAVYCEKDDRHRVWDILEEYQFSQFKYPYERMPLEELDYVFREKREVENDVNSVKMQLEQLSHRLDDMYLFEEALVNERERVKARASFNVSENVVALSGWIAVDRMDHLKRLLQETLSHHRHVLLLDTQVVDEADIPIVLKNHPLVEPFEVLTDMYSLPKYNEVDPTPYMMPFYATFFGLMVADIGYGLLMWLGTLLLLKQKNMTPSATKNVKMFHIVSYPTILWGVIFGSFFSFDTGFALLSVTTSGMSLLMLSVAFGLIQLMFGLLIKAKESFKVHDISSAISDGIAWVGLLLGAVMYVLGGQSGLNWLQPIGQYVAIGSAISIIIFTIVGSKNKWLGIGSGLYKLYGISSYIGDIASYTRLMALCVAGASIGAAFNQIILMLPPVARFSVGILLFIVLHALNFGLAVLGAYVHGIRLMFVEFFGKFYEGGGRKHNPLKTYEKYVDIKQRQMEDK